MSLSRAVSSHLGRPRPILVNVGQKLFEICPQLGRDRSKLGRVPSNFVCGSLPHICGRLRSKHLPNFGQHRPHIGPTSAKLWSTSATHWSNSARVRSKSVQVWPVLCGRSGTHRPPDAFHRGSARTIQQGGVQSGRRHCPHRRRCVAPGNGRGSPCNWDGGELHETPGEARRGRSCAAQHQEWG